MRLFEKTRTRTLLVAKCILAKIQERKLKSNDALIFIITGVKFLVSDQVISEVSILSYMCGFPLVYIASIVHRGAGDGGGGGGGGGGGRLTDSLYETQSTH